MKLGIYLRDRGITQEAFAKLIGEDQGAVSRFVAGKRIPNPRAMRAIMRVTDGVVDAKDFYIDHDDDDGSTAWPRDSKGQAAA